MFVVFLPDCSAESDYCWFHSKLFCCTENTAIWIQNTGVKILHHQIHLQPLLGVFHRKQPLACCCVAFMLFGCAFLVFCALAVLHF